MSSARAPGLIQRYREELQTRHYARRTVKTYEQWLRRFLRFHLMRHPREMGSAEVNAFLSHLAVELKVSASTQNQALAALLFLYRDVLESDLELEGLVRARTRRRLPVVLTPEEVRVVLERLTGAEALVAGLLYGSGLRLMEALRLRVQDLNFGRRELIVRDGKGGKHRPGQGFEVVGDEQAGDQHQRTQHGDLFVGLALEGAGFTALYHIEQHSTAGACKGGTDRHPPPAQVGLEGDPCTNDREGGQADAVANAQHQDEAGADGGPRFEQVVQKQAAGDHRHHNQDVSAVFENEWR